MQPSRCFKFGVRRRAVRQEIGDGLARRNRTWNYSTGPYLCTHPVLFKGSQKFYWRVQKDLNVSRKFLGSEKQKILSRLNRLKMDLNCVDAGMRDAISINKRVNLA